MKKWKDKDWLEEEYVKKERSTVSIGLSEGTTPMTIWRWLKKFRIKSRTVKESLTGKRKMALEEAAEIVREIEDFMEEDEFKGDKAVQEATRLKGERENEQRRLINHSRKKLLERRRLAEQMSKEKEKVKAGFWATGDIKEELSEFQNAINESGERERLEQATRREKEHLEGIEK